MPVPQTLGKYALIDRIATGGMAEVYLAHHKGMAGLNKTVVVKRIRPEYAEDPRFVNMFINEARVTANLNHPNVVQVYELDRAQGTWFIAMEHLHGRDLTRLLRRLRAMERRMPAEMSAWIVAEACRGLHYAHSRPNAEGGPSGLVHQDVSPHNILVTFDGQVKLVDFGIARFMAQARQDEDSHTPAGRGKYAYMSPEQASGKVVDHRTDIWSAAVVLWEMLTGTRPFAGRDPAEKLMQIKAGELGDPRAAGAEVDDALVAVLAKATEVDREDRHGSAALLEEDLRAWLFERRSRVGGPEVAAWMKEAFPDLAARTFAQLPLQALRDDLERLDTEVAEELPLGDVSLPGLLTESAGERKQVSVLVVDVDGLTELSARVEPERLFMRRYQLLKWARGIVDAHGGVIQRAVDDHIFILFGVPRTRVGDLSRAMDCGLELVRRKGELARKGLALELCIGLHTGEVSIGMLRNRVQYQARGNTTRLARRLSATADHGEILVSERVVQAMEGMFVLKRGPSISSRGGQDGLPSYLLLRRRSGLRVSAKGPWMRRGREVDLLRASFGGLAEGRGSAIALVGPVGCGKSRLVREVQQLAARRQIPFYLVRCVEYGGGAGRVFRDLVREVLGVPDDLDHEGIRLHLRGATELGMAERQQAVLAAGLGVPISNPPERSEVELVLLQLVRALTDSGAALIAFEDAQALDRRDARTLARLIKTTDDRPAVYLVACRDRLPDILAEACTVAPLDPFTDDAQDRMLQALLEVRHVDAQLADLIKRTCEGNPLYLEEMVKYLLEEGLLQITAEGALLTQPDLPDLPDSLHSLIAARIDALDAASKGALQLAAVIGPTFPTSLLAEAAGLDDPAALIVDLASCGLIIRNDEPDTWAFATELVREAALRGILGVQRRDYHRLVSSALESLHSGHIERHARALAEHCAHGGRLVDAARYSFMAGQQAEENQELEEARRWYRLGLDWLGDAERTADSWDARVQGEAMLNFRIGAIDLLLGETLRGERSLVLSLDIAGDAGLPWIEVRAHLELGRGYMHQGRMGLANAHLSQARSLLAFEDDPRLEVEALEAAANLAFEEGRNEEAQGLWEEALQRAGSDPLARARCQLGLANRYLRTGHHDKAEPLLQEALGSARVAGDRILEGRVLNNIGLVHSWADRQDEALSFYRQALQVREGIGYSRGVVINHHNIGDVHFRKGEFSRAYVAFERSREFAQRIGWVRGGVLNEVFLAYIDAARGDADLATLRLATERARELGDAEIATTGLWLAGRWLSEQGREAEARAELQAALQQAEEWELMPIAELVRSGLTALGH